MMNTVDTRVPITTLDIPNKGEVHIHIESMHQNYEPIRREPRYEDSRPIQEKERLPDPGNLHVCMSESLICSWSWRECHYRTIKGCFWQVW
jgi:hypothetical protein